MRKHNILSLVLLLLLTLVLVGCNANEETETEYVTPSITSGDTVVLSGTHNSINYSVTKADVYSYVRQNGNLVLLLDALDEELLSDKISQITTDSVFYKNRYNLIVYGTYNEDEINALSDSEKSSSLTQYDYSMDIAGLSSDSDREAYLKLEAARDMVAFNYMKSEVTNSKSDYYYSVNDREDYYNSYYYQNAKALIIDFDNLIDLRNTLKEKNIVNYNSELRTYTGTESIDDISQSDLSDENTQVLTSAEALSLFVELFNNSNSYKDDVTTTSVLTDTLFDYNFSLLSKNALALAQYVFGMDKDEYTYTTYTSTTSLGSTYSLIYRLDGGDRLSYSELSDDAKDDVLDHYVYSLIYGSTKYQIEALKELRSDENIVFYDRDLAYQYNLYVSSSDDLLKAEGDSSKLVATDNASITADELYDYAINRNEGFYLLCGSLKAIEETLNTYNKFYGDEKDLVSNASLRKVYYYDLIKSDLTNNYDEESYGAESVYLFNKYQASSVEEALYNYYLEPDLRTIALTEALLTVDSDLNATVNSDYTQGFEDILDEYYNKHYNLYAYQVNITTDYDGNYEADDLADVFDNPTKYGLDSTKVETIKAKLASLYLVIDGLFDADTEDSEVATILSDFVSEYKNSSRTSGTYSEYKQLGFKLAYNKPTASSTSAITYANYSAKATDKINEVYRDLYEDICASSTSEYYLYSASTSYNFLNTVDENGAHYIACTKGTESSQPSFKYTLSEDNASKYNANCANENNEPSLNQLTNAFLIYFYSLIAGSSDIAELNFNITEYPLPFPSSISFTNYTQALADYYYSPEFAYQYFLGLLVSESNASTDLVSKFNNLKVAYNYILSE